ncbi:uncharacterized protein C11orf98 homolog [Antedon mediterranea]|uniref:uncharacterized protein C11orf98 homolog n=1 Tax=Antedon mediterranea TaxID=105859 RepID=UPI003AF7CB1C
MPPSSKINRPKTDLQKNHAKRRRLKTIQKKKNKQKGQETVGKEESTILNYHRRRKRTDPHAVVKPSNKKKRKLIKAILRSDKERNAMQVEVVNDTLSRKGKKKKSSDAGVEAMET